LRRTLQQKIFEEQFDANINVNPMFPFCVHRWIIS
jgi:hypothetical protein